ncbi:MAG: Ca-activated chloride channel [Clostridia bacterium]|nr:Ca-activated chloride channel [Clostridia bacterium]
MFNKSAFFNSRAGGVALLEVLDQELARENNRRLFVPLRYTKLYGEISGPLASMCLTHVYGYTREQYTKVLEAVYRFPLPGDAAITGVTVQFGRVSIHTELRPRAEAEELYARARKEGRQAVLVSRESPDVFTLWVTGIRPDEEVRVETLYVQLAQPVGTGWWLRVPLTTPPRYVRGDERSSRHASGQPLMLMRDPEHRFSLDVLVRGASRAVSATHRLTEVAEGGNIRLQLEQGEVIPDRDFVLEWWPLRSEELPLLGIDMHLDCETRDVYFLALVAPPSQMPGRIAPREIIILVDHSGSMSGPKWEAADWAVKKFLVGLTEHDSFNLGVFHDRTKWFAKEPLRADTATVERAIRFLLANRDSGGTELGVALEQALCQKRAGGDMARHVLVITDAQVSDTGRILRLVEKERVREDRRRVSVLCIDAAPNSYLVSRIVKEGGGVARFLTSSPEEGDIATALEEILKDWTEPVLTGMTLSVDRPCVQIAGCRSHTSESGKETLGDLGDLPCGRTRWVIGYIPGPVHGELNFCLTESSRSFAMTVRFGEVEETWCRQALKAFFGAERILALEQLVHGMYEDTELEKHLEELGYEPDKELLALDGDRRVYPENVRRQHEEAIRHLLVKESLRYGLACSETAFVAVRREAGAEVEEVVPVANALPHGWDEDFVLAVGQPDFDVSFMLSPACDAVLQCRIFDHQPCSGGRVIRIFSGVPQFENGEAVLFDSCRDADRVRLPETAVISRLEVRFPKGGSEPPALDSDLYLLVYVGDILIPCVRVRLVELLRLGGTRPLNIMKASDMPVRVVLTGRPEVARPKMSEMEITLVM